MENDDLNEENHMELSEVVEPEEDHADEDTDNLKNQVDTLQDKILRAMAESENMRRRYEKTIEEGRDYAIVSFAKDLVGVMDNLHRALEYKDQKHEDNDVISTVITGVEMTKKELESVFHKHGITSITPIPGEKFDYNLHQAIAQIATDEYEKDCVVTIMQSGYRIKERLLRPAIVTVSNRSAKN